MTGILELILYPADKMSTIKNEIAKLLFIIKNLDKKVVIVLISVPLILTFSRYYTSRAFFQQHFSVYFSNNGNTGLYEFAFWFAGDFISLFVFPWLIIKLIFKEKIKDYGIASGDVKTGLKLSALFIIIMIPLIWIATTTEGFILIYPMLAEARGSWAIFFIFESGILFYIFAWEFFFRGFMLSGLKDKFGYYAVLIQVIPFVILHFGKPAAESFGAILGGFALGILAYRTKSIYYCIIAHAGVMFSIDAISALRYRANDFGLGIHSLLHIVKQII